MGWPKKNEIARLYREVADGSYMLVDLANGMSNGQYEAIANVHAGPTPCCGGTAASPLYLLNRCRRVSWDELPEEWRREFSRWLAWDDLGPGDVPGFWRTGTCPTS